MMKERVLEKIEPGEVFHFFEDLTEIPRGSGNERQVSEYAIDFAKIHGLQWLRDEFFNVLIRRPASPGYEGVPGVILQAHMDMVCEKNKNVVHDFKRDPIPIAVEGDRIIARDTTLGADNGLGVALGLAMLADEKNAYPQLELLLTTKEELDLSGAEQFDTSLLEGRILVNLDGAEEGAFVVGSAGGPSVNGVLPLFREKAKPGLKAMVIIIRGLKGGHSGEDIHRGRANANKLMARLLAALDQRVGIQLVSIEGGVFNNAIPREAQAEILVKPSAVRELTSVVEEYRESFQREYKETDPGVTVLLNEMERIPEEVFHPQKMEKVILFGNLCETGILRMHPEMEGVVESSNSLGVVRTGANSVTFQFVTRSSLPSIYTDMKNKIDMLSRLLGGYSEIDSNCLEWTYNPDSQVKRMFQDTYRDLFGKEAGILIVHGGLECGIIGKHKNDGLDMISIGPDIRELHAPGEWVSISSVQRVWKFLQVAFQKMESYFM